ncbi:MAG TPA: hypothetical protein VN516_09750 [Candidatus Baltobacteraceae bacterium]|nr:hypothetical protein [Candidatus Baltobacteraceae bacterium]
MNAILSPVYSSRRLAVNLWQEYKIFSDRLELQSWILFRTIIVPAHEIVKIEIRPSIFGGFKGFTWGIKLDSTDLHRHVLIRREQGFFKNIAFTPNNPEEFVRICKSIAPRVG